MNIFLVEDNPLIRANLIEYLEELIPGVNIVGWASTQEHSVEWLSGGGEWDMAVVDLFLTQGNGMGVLKALVARAPERKVVILTNYATQDIRDRCLACGADAVFDKSQEIDEFMAFAKTASEAVYVTDNGRKPRAPT